MLSRSRTHFFIITIVSVRHARDAVAKSGFVYRILMVDIFFLSRRPYRLKNVTGITP